jgi:hypothetical protein
MAGGFMEACMDERPEWPKGGPYRDYEENRPESPPMRSRLPARETDFGTRRYRALDPEGYEWSFGSYRPATRGAQVVRRGGGVILPRRPSCLGYGFR